MTMPTPPTTATEPVAPIAVTGSTGQLGGRLAERLARAGAAQRLLVRDPSRAPQLPGAAVLVAPYDDGDAVREALLGTSTVFMVSASECPERLAQHRSFLDAAVAAGVGHVVYTSFYGAGPRSTFTHGRLHAATEEHLRASGLPFTILRDNLYADVLLDLAGADGVIRGPAADGRLSAVARDDVADVAAAVLRAPQEHAGRTYDLTGPRDLTLTEVADTLTAATGRTVTYEQETLEEAYASRASFGAPRWLVDAWVSTYTAVAAGEMAGVSTAVADVTGRPATSLEDLLRRSP